jgi:cell division protein FtsQ
MKRVWVAVSALVAFTLVAVIWFSGVFSTDDVEVVGVPVSIGNRVEAAAQVPLGRPLARIDTDAVAADVEAALPEVTSVQVQRRWPNTLRITVTPRSVAANVTSNGAVHWVDPGGVEFGPTDEPKRGAPSIVLVERFADDESAEREAAVRDSLSVIASLPPQVRSRLVRVEHRSSDDLTVILNPRGVRVRWGSAEDSARKAVVLAALLPRKAAVYDVSAPDLPTTKGKEPRSSRS